MEKYSKEENVTILMERNTEEIKFYSLATQAYSNKLDSTVDSRGGLRKRVEGSIVLFVVLIIESAYLKLIIPSGGFASMLARIIFSSSFV